LINIILSSAEHQEADLADVNDDGEVNIADINSVIGIIMGQ
jgi:hypothetical protein